MDTQNEHRARKRQRAQWRLWWRWIGVCAVGELVGVPLAMLIGTAPIWTSAPADHIWGTVSLIAAGALAGGVNGAVVGGLQWLALRRPLRRLSGWRWTLATAVPWALVLGMSGPLRLGQGTDERLLGELLLLGLLVGALLGGAQWLVLRRLLPQAAWWILVSLVAWLLGLCVLLAGASLLPPGFSLWALLLVSSVTGLVLGSLVGAVSGLVLVALVRLQVVRRPWQVSGPASRSGRPAPTFDLDAARAVWAEMARRR